MSTKQALPADTRRFAPRKGVGLILCLVLTKFLLSETNETIYLAIWGIVSIFFSILITYTFVWHLEESKYGRPAPYNNLYRNDSFQPNVIRPSGMKKKTQVEGHCSYCGVSALMGFTCSYCGKYFCNDHRLPEKHECSGLYK